MKLKEIEENLPNGLHDAQIEKIEIDYIDKKAKIKLNLWVGDLSSKVESEREAYQKAELIISELIYFIIEPPDPSSSSSPKKTLTIGAGSAKEEPIKTQIVIPQNLPEEAFSYWFFVHEWNSFIHFAAIKAEIKFE